MVQFTVVHKVGPADCRTDSIGVLPHFLLLKHWWEFILHRLWLLRSLWSTTEESSIEVQNLLSIWVISQKFNRFQILTVLRIITHWVDLVFFVNAWNFLQRWGHFRDLDSLVIITQLVYQLLAVWHVWGWHVHTMDVLKLLSELLLH